MQKMKWTISAISDRGLQRSENQDNYYISPDERVLVVADGLGGAAHGAIASRLAVEAVEETWQESPPDLSNLEATQTWLTDVVAKANRAILDWPGSDVSDRPGTTIVMAALCDDGTMTFAHVGDSRAYVVRDGDAKPVTIDHSVVMDMVRKYKISEEQAWSNPYRNLLTRCLGHDPEVEVEHTVADFAPGDWVILCSDGLNCVLRDNEIGEVVSQSESPVQACDGLVDNVFWRKAPDNVTIIAVHYETANGNG